MMISKFIAPVFKIIDKGNFEAKGIIISVHKGSVEGKVSDICPYCSYPNSPIISYTFAYPLSFITILSIRTTCISNKCKYTHLNSL